MSRIECSFSQALFIASEFCTVAGSFTARRRRYSSVAE